TPAIPDILAYVRPIASGILSRTPGSKLPRSRCVTHSVPKRKHLRRTVSIPHPLHQSVLADEIADNWGELETFCAQSPLSLSAPKPSTDRAIIPTNELNTQPVFRAQRSVGARYLLKTDISRYYPSIYTHSVPWALHNKTTARADRNFGLL